MAHDPMRDQILARLLCHHAGYPVHIGCLGECTPTNPVATSYRCAKCNRRTIAPSDVAEPPSHRHYEDDVDYLCGKLGWLTEDDEARTPTVHILHHGQVLCGFNKQVPRRWPSGNVWVRVEQFEKASCSACLKTLTRMGAMSLVRLPNDRIL